MTFAPGTLVRAHGREWVVLPEFEEAFLAVRPLGDTSQETSGNPVFNAQLIEMAIPDKPRSSKQRYRLTEKGRAWLRSRQGRDLSDTGTSGRDSFNVNSKNYREVSGGTRAWIAECRRLLDRCVQATGKGKPAETQEAFKVIFALLRHIDEGHDNVIFFADEGGSWQVGVDWQKVLSAWFTCLSATAEPDVYSLRIVDVVDRFVKYDRDKYLAIAARKGSAAQRKALAERTHWNSRKAGKRR
jgi:DNA-binding PadR family transcriptional regulator